MSSFLENTVRLEIKLKSGPMGSEGSKEEQETKISNYIAKATKDADKDLIALNLFGDRRLIVVLMEVGMTLEEVPETHLSHLTGLTELSLSANSIENIDQIGEWATSLRTLDLSKNALKTIGPSLSPLSNLQSLKLQSNPLSNECVPGCFLPMCSLEVLDLYRCHLGVLSKK